MNRGDQGNARSGIRSRTFISTTQWRSPVGRQSLYKMVRNEMNPIAGKSRAYRHLTGFQRAITSVETSARLVTR